MSLNNLIGSALSVLLKYARAASVNVNVLMDDDLDLPAVFRDQRITNTNKGRVGPTKQTRRKRT